MHASPQLLLASIRENNWPIGGRNLAKACCHKCILLTDTTLNPGHFLIGRPLSSISQPKYQDHSTNHITRLQRIEQLRQHFWARWSNEYVAELQQSTKWRSCKDNLRLNSLVVFRIVNIQTSIGVINEEHFTESARYQ
ncbi:unnamed protein product [Euphydryas editha]|uniref:DUF5641 domain-containing protein n=1 Tax=Euphydryas editha TaxID=104508 RepID=A0AAU9UWH7_EUPED|nr:unnamed protein product [Euphydryas editha]